MNNVTDDIMKEDLRNKKVDLVHKIINDISDRLYDGKYITEKEESLIKYIGKPIYSKNTHCCINCKNIENMEYYWKCFKINEEFNDYSDKLFSENNCKLFFSKKDEK